MRRLGDLLFLPSEDEDEDEDDGRERSRWAGVALLAVLTTTALSASMALAVPDLLITDETAHLAYVDDLLDRSLPTVDDPIEASDRFPALAESLSRQGGDASTGGPHGDVWTANHPPLAHLVTAVPAGIAADLGATSLATTMPRLVNLLTTAVGLLAVAAVCDALMPGRRSVAVAAVVIAGLAPNLLGTAAAGRTDGFTFMVAAVTLALVLRHARRPGGRRMLVALAVALAAAAACRAALLPLVPIAAAAWIATPPTRSGVGRRVVGSVLLVLAPLVAAGWFYARNLDLYGSVTGSSHLLQTFDRSAPGADALTDLRYPLGIWQGWWGSLTETVQLGSGQGSTAGRPASIGSTLLVGAVVAGLAAAGWLRTASRELRRARATAAGWVVWSAASAWLLASTVGVVSFVAAGGTPHPRYLLPAVPILAPLLAAGLVQLAPRSGRALLGVAAALAVTDVVLVLRLRAIPQIALQTPYGEALGHPLAYHVLSPVALGCGVVLVVVALVQWDHALAADLGTTPAGRTP